MLFPQEWLNAIELIAKDDKENKKVVFLGANDSGKSTICHLLANEEIKYNRSVGVIDADVGQSNIGPPATIGLGIVEKEITSLLDAKIHSLYFIGSITPSGNLVPIITSIAKLLSRAVKLKLSTVLFNTTGFVFGEEGIKLKIYKVEIIEPDYIILLEKSTEQQYLKKYLQTKGNSKIIPLSIPEYIGRKSKEERIDKRTEMFKNYFKNASSNSLKIIDDKIITLNMPLFWGDKLPISERRFIFSELGGNVIHIEKFFKDLIIIVDSEVDDKCSLKLKIHLPYNNIKLIKYEEFKDLVIGLCSAEGEVITIGILKEINFSNKELLFISPQFDINEVRIVNFGSFKLKI